MSQGLGCLFYVFLQSVLDGDGRGGSGGGGNDTSRSFGMEGLISVACSLFLYACALGLL